MNVAYQAYGQTQTLAVRGRQAEAEALLKAARMLTDAKDHPLTPRDMITALRYNHNLWATLQADCASDQSPLTKSLRADIISLSLYVEKQTMLVMAGNGNVDSLVDINRQIASGLLR